MSEEEYSQKDYKKIILLLLKNLNSFCLDHKTMLLIINIDLNKIEDMDNFCSELSIPYLDLSGILSSASRFKKLRFDIDGHYNEFTDRVIGEYVSDYLKNKCRLGENKDFKYQFLNRF